MNAVALFLLFCLVERGQTCAQAVAVQLMHTGDTDGQAASI